MEKGLVKMQIREKLFTCGCCKHKCKGIEILSYYSKDCFLDGKPESKKFLPQIKECPDCHYMSYDIEASVNEVTRHIVNSMEYRKIVELHSFGYQYEALLKLAQNDSQKAMILRRYCWMAEFCSETQLAIEKRKVSNELQRNEIMQNPQAETVMMYIDSVRLLGQFDLAGEMLEAIAESIIENKDKQVKIYLIYIAEREFVKKRDKSPHRISEVVE